MGDRRGHEVDGRRQVRRSLESRQVRQDHTESIVAGEPKLLARHQLSQLRQARLVDTGVKTAIIDDPTEEGVRSAQASEQGRRPPGELADPGHLLDGPEGSQAFDHALLPSPPPIAGPPRPDRPSRTTRPPRHSSQSLLSNPVRFDLMTVWC